MCLGNVFQWYNSLVPFCSKQTHLGSTLRLSKVVAFFPHLGCDQLRSFGKSFPILCSFHGCEATPTVLCNCCEHHHCLFDGLVIVHAFLHNL
jgi:hypothetical protein